MKPSVGAACVLGLLVCLGQSTVRTEETGHETTATTVTTTTPPPTTTTRKPNMYQSLKAFLQSAMTSPEVGAISRKVLEADISASCTLGLLKFMRGIRNLDPWAVRLIDASGKYPTGLFQGTWADIGAYDECVETLVKDNYGHEMIRGQYCNMYVQMGNDSSFLDAMRPAFLMSHSRATLFLDLQKDKRVEGMRLGICFISDCSKEDIQSLINSMTGGTPKLTIKDCTTNERPPITTAQAIIASVLGVTALMVILSSILDLHLTRKEGKQGKRSRGMKVLTAFSLQANTKIILEVNRDKSSEAYRYRFLHGIRFFSVFWIVLGHTCIAFDPIVARFVNVMNVAGSWSFLLFSSAFLAVDTFFFLSGFLLAYNVLKQKQNRILIGVIATTRRQIRVIVPVFFAIMCYYLLPLMVSGPNSKVLFEKYYVEVQTRWWQLLLQIRNFYTATDLECFSHLWYISTDFQLFLVSLVVMLVFRSKVVWMATTFVVLSLASCCYTAWQMHGEAYLPVIPPVIDKIQTLADTFNEVYITATFHAACYFMGCLTVLILNHYRETKISKSTQVVMWCIGLVCGAVSIFARRHWNSGEVKPGNWENVTFGFLDRILWALFLGWLVFACASGRGGFLCRFLSWGAFVPLSRLGFGIYIFHLPYFVTMHYVQRERLYYSFGGVVTLALSIFIWSSFLAYFMFVLCEAPTGRIEKLIFMPERLRVNPAEEKLPISQNPVQVYGCPTLIVTPDKVVHENGTVKDHFSHL